MTTCFWFFLISSSIVSQNGKISFFFNFMQEFVDFPKIMMVPNVGPSWRRRKDMIKSITDTWPCSLLIYYYHASLVMKSEYSPICGPLWESNLFSETVSHFSMMFNMGPF